MTDDRIPLALVEQLAMTHRTGKRALALGVASALVAALKTDLKARYTRRRVDDWLDAIDERWLQARLRERRILRADVTARELANPQGQLDRALLKFHAGPLRREEELQAAYGERGEAA